MHPKPNPPGFLHSKNPSSVAFRYQILSTWQQLKHNLSLKSVEEPYIYESVLQLGPHCSMVVLYSDAKGLAARQSLDDELRRGSLSMAVQTLESGYKIVLFGLCLFQSTEED